VDIIVEMRRLHPEDRKDTRRVLTGYGRYEQTPIELVVNLGEEGYTAEGDRAEVQTRDLSTILDKIIPADPPGKTREELLEVWPGDHGPNQTALDKALKTGAESKRWVRTGKGKRGDPYHYHRDGYVNPEATPEDLRVIPFPSEQETTHDPPSAGD
jgi:hypothetical protein